jgi:hypothetical protein
MTSESLTSTIDLKAAHDRTGHGEYFRAYSTFTVAEKTSADLGFLPGEITQ